MLRIIATFDDLPNGRVVHYFAPDGKCTQIVVVQNGKEAKIFDPTPVKERETAQKVRARLVKHSGKIVFDNLPK